MVEDCLKVFLSAFQRSVKGKSRRFQGSLKNVSRVFQGWAVLIKFMFALQLSHPPNGMAGLLFDQTQSQELLRLSLCGVWLTCLTTHYIHFQSWIKIVPSQNYSHQSCLRIQIHIWCKLIFNPAELGKFLGCIKTGWGVSKFFRLID